MGRLYDGRRDRPVAWWQSKISSTLTSNSAARLLLPQIRSAFFPGLRRSLPGWWATWTYSPQARKTKPVRFRRPPDFSCLTGPVSCFHSGRQYGYDIFTLPSANPKGNIFRENSRCLHNSPHKFLWRLLNHYYATTYNKLHPRAVVFHNAAPERCRPRRLFSSIFSFAITRVAATLCVTR
jgi:hypothetical protein